jgi:hypothetical protein
MKIRISISKDDKELASQTGDVSKSGDLGVLIENTFNEARAKTSQSLIDCEVFIREA